jgi:hypothetical protein
VYATSGIRTATLTVTDAIGRVASDAAVVTVDPPPAITVTTEADTHLQGNGVICGSCPTLRSKNSTDPLLDRKAFVRWQVPAGVTSVTSAKVRFNVTAVEPTGNPGLSVYPVSNDTWTEATTTAPVNSASIGTKAVTALGWVEYDVTSLVNSSLAAADTRVSILLFDSGPYDRFVDFSAREAGASVAPQLVLQQ